MDGREDCRVRSLPFASCVCRYSMAESIDAQLKRVGHDLKDIIEQINTANIAQGDDSPVSLGKG